MLGDHFLMLYRFQYRKTNRLNSIWFATKKSSIRSSKCRNNISNPYPILPKTFSNKCQNVILNPPEGGSIRRFADVYANRFWRAVNCASNVELLQRKSQMHAYLWKHFEMVLSKLICSRTWLADIQNLNFTFACFDLLAFAVVVYFQWKLWFCLLP